MLKFMREHAGSWIIKILLGAIIVVFIAWGAETFRSPSNTEIATVNEEMISLEDYYQAYDHMIEQYRQRFGGKLDEDMIRKLGLKKQALDTLIDEKLLIQEAAGLGIRVSDDELADAIGKMEAFRNGGVFDKAQYECVLNRNRLTPERFEVLQRNAMITGKVRSLVLDSIRVSDDEISEWFQWNNAKIKVDYVLFDPAKYTDIQPTEDEIRAYHDGHRESYKSELKAKARYAYFNPEPHKAGVKITDEDIKAYYDANGQEFHNPKTVEARHILIKTESDSPQDVIDKKKEKALEVHKLATDKDRKKDFAELAKTYSEDPGSKDKGGSLGAFKKEAMVKPFADKAFSMQPGEISEPVLSQFGWHIIKVEKVNEESVQTLEQAKEKIAKKLTDEKAKSLAYEDANKFYEAMGVSRDMDKAAAELKVNPVTTDFFTRRGPENGVKNRPRFASAAMNLEANDISDIQDLGDGYYIIQVLEKVQEQVQELSEVAEKVKADLIKEKQGEKASHDAADFLAAVNKEGGSPEDEAKTRNLAIASTDFFKRNDSIPEIGYEPDIAKAAFGLSDAKKIAPNPLKGRKGYYVIRLKEKKLPEAAEFEKEKESVRERLLQQKKFKNMETWISELKAKSRIRIEESYMN